MSKVVTANALAVGNVVFLGTNETWVTDLDAAVIYPDAMSAEAGMTLARRDAAASIIVEPFIADTGLGADGRPAMTMRDSIRAHGPTIRYLPADFAGARG